MSAEFLSGATMVASTVIALFFLRYWRETRDRLFLMFAGGFFTFALSRLLLAFLDEEDEGRVLVYMLRLVAFAPHSRCDRGEEQVISTGQPRGVSALIRVVIEGTPTGHTPAGARLRPLGLRLKYSSDCDPVPR